MYNRGQGRQQYQAREVGNRAYGQEFQQGNYGRQEDEGYGQQQFGQSDYGPGREYGEGDFGYGSQYPNQGQSRSYGNRGDQGSRGYEGNRPYYQGGQGYEGTRGGYSEPYYGGSGQPYSGQSYSRGDYGWQGRGQQRGWWDRAGDEVRSWFGDEEAARRRQFDEQRGGYGSFYSSHNRPNYGSSYGRSDYGSGYSGMSAGQTSGLHVGRGPKGWKRGDERIMEDVCQRLTDHPGIDASDIEVKVDNGGVTLTGTVDDRRIKRMAEDTAEDVSGVTEVHNQLRVKREGAESTPNANQGRQQGRQQSDRGIQRATS